MMTHWKSFAAAIAPIGVIVAVLTFASKPISFFFTMEKRLSQMESAIVADNRLRDEQLAAIQNILIPLIIDRPSVLGESYVSEKKTPNGLEAPYPTPPPLDRTAEWVATSKTLTFEPMEPIALNKAEEYMPPFPTFTADDIDSATMTAAPPVAVSDVYDALKIPVEQRALTP